MITESQANNVLTALRSRRKSSFSSHDFIEEFCKQYEDDYLDLLMHYHGTGIAFQTVHSQIGKFLSEHEHSLMPLYHRIGRQPSETIHGTEDNPMWWKFE